MIIGLAGKKQVGKSTVSERLATYGFVRVSFSSPMKEMASHLLKNIGLTPFEIAQAEDNKESIIPQLGKSYRVLLQTLGTEWGRNINPDLWLICAEQRMKQLADKHVIFDDVRFDNEAELIRSKGGLIIHLIRHTGEIDKHASEYGLTFRPGDALVGNNGSLEGLFNRVYLAMEARFGEAL